jgi:hypothetical protein
MRRRLLIGALAATVLSVTAIAWAQTNPSLLSAKSQHRHLVLVARFGELAPLDVRVASRPATGRTGALLPANVRYSARFTGAQAANGTRRWRSVGKLKRGVYWVQVSGEETGGVTGCPPKLPNCVTHWSNVRRLVIS